MSILDVFSIKTGLPIVVLIIFVVAIIRAVLQIRYELSQRRVSKNSGRTAPIPTRDNEALRRQMILQQRQAHQQAVDEHLRSVDSFSREQERAASEAVQVAHNVTEAQNRTYSQDVAAHNEDQLHMDRQHYDQQQHMDQQMFGPNDGMGF